MERTLIPKEYSPKTIEHILENAFGKPIIFKTTPAYGGIKANTWGFYDDSLYIKFANGVVLKFTGTVIT